MQTTERTSAANTNLSTAMTDLGSVVGFNPLHNNSFSFSFVSDEVLQLEKTPIANPIVHSFSSINLPDAFKVFHHNPISIKVNNNLLANIVVNPSHKTSFSSAHFNKQSVSRASAFGLQFGTQILESSFDFFDFDSEEFSLRSNRQVSYSQINTKDFLIKRGEINLFRESKEKETSSFLVDSQETFFDFPFIKILPITIRNIQKTFFSSFDCSEGKDLSIQASTSGKVISDGSSFDAWLGFSFLDNSTGLSDASYGQLRRQTTFPKLLVNQRMQPDVVLDFMFPGSVDAELQSLFVDFESSNYLGSCRNLYFSGGSSQHGIFNGRTGLYTSPALVHLSTTFINHPLKAKNFRDRKAEYWTKLGVFGCPLLNYLSTLTLRFSRRTSNLNLLAKPKAIREVLLNENLQTSNHCQMGDCYGEKQISTLQSKEVSIRCQNSNSADWTSLQIQHQLPPYLDTKISQTYIAR
jgi:hypothetical protein